MAHRTTPPMDVGPVTLEGRLVRLEPLGPSHVDDLVAAADPSVWRWTAEANDGADAVRAHLERAMASASDGSAVVFATVERATGTAVGSTRYLAIDRVHRHLEIGWTWLSPRLHGRGHNDEAKLLMLAHAFERLGCHRVEFKTDSLNERSRGALLGIGATFEGIFRRHMVMPDGRLRHSAWYSVIDEEWPIVRPALEARLASRPAWRQAKGSGPPTGSRSRGRRSRGRRGRGAATGQWRTRSFLADLEDAIPGLGGGRADHDDVACPAAQEGLAHR